MDTMEFSRFWEGQSLGDYAFASSPTADAESKFNFLDEIANVAETQLEKNDKVKDPLYDTADLFPDWTELKDDFTLLDNLDNLVDFLDDPNLVIKQEDSFKLPIYPVDSPTHGDLSGFNSFMSSEHNSVLASPPYSNPNSPEGLVPSVTPPNSPSSVNSFEFAPQATAAYDINQPSTSEVNSILVQPGISLELGDCLALTDSFIILAETSNDNFSTISTTPSSAESLALSHVGEEHLVIPLEDSDSNDEPPAPASRGRKRKVVQTDSDTSSKLIRVSESPKKALPKTRKERKRIQNKDAATRYRQKKRQEADTVFAQEDALLAVNVELKEKVQNLSTEIKYLKNLMCEMFKAKGLLK